MKIKNQTIKKISAKEIIDSRGKSTIKVDLFCGPNRFSASVPSGTSTGKFEAKVKDIKFAIKNIDKIIGPEIIGRSVNNQSEIDDLLIRLDGTKDKSRLGGNATLAVSMACLRAGAKSQGLPLWKWISRISRIKPRLPYPSLLQVEGGLHAAKGGTDIQEFMTVLRERSFKENFRQGFKIYKALKKILLEKYGKSAVVLGLEGAFTPSIKSAEEILSLIISAAKKVGLDKKVKIILDVAASHDYPRKTADFYLGLLENYPVLGLEDPFPENDWKNWRAIMSKIKNKKLKTMIIGDDLTVTNVNRMEEAKRKKACNALIIKPNQIGTVSETIAAVKLAKSFGWQIIVSHRSGETMDDFIADLAVGVGADFIKSGAPSKPERMVKYNRLIEIEKELWQN
ncbi:MAG: enolase C-terminal domain-like protein [bacterium]|nr:enolase C-terminal domain-like protein [bacterium]